MPTYDEATLALLDDCIQALIDGDDWRDIPPEQAAEEMAPLLAVGRWLLQMARGTPAGSGSTRERIWKRVTNAIDARGLSIWLRPMRAFTPDGRRGLAL